MGGQLVDLFSVVQRTTVVYADLKITDLEFSVSLPRNAVYIPLPAKLYLNYLSEGHHNYSFKE